MTFKITGPLIQSVAVILSHHIQEADAASLEFILCMAELDIATAKCFSLAAPPVDDTTEELLDAARALITMPMPQPGVFARQARRRRARLYFGYLRAAARRNEADDWRREFPTKIEGAKVLLRMVAAGIDYLFLGRQPAGGAK